MSTVRVTPANVQASAPALEDAPPARIGRFLVFGKLGKGAMGVVHAAYDPKLDRKVAIKLVDLSRARHRARQAHARLEREARAAASLTHPNVVTVYELGRHRDGAFLAMELVEGGTLRQWWREKPRTIREIVAMFLDAGRGLHAAHARGIVHRDFKPGNVLVGADGRARVADFGLAFPVDGWSRHDAARAAWSGGTPDDSVTLESTSQGSIYGTPAYMSPEQYRGTEVSPRSDQFAYAVALFEAIYGNRPFVGLTASAVADAVLCHRVTVPRGARKRVPRALAEIIARGMAHQPDDRYPDVGAMVAALERFLGRRRRRISAGAAVAVAALGLGAGHRVAVAAAADPCANVLAPIDGAWGDAVANEVAGAMGEQWRWPEMRDELDAYADAWGDRRLAACTATRVDATQSEHALQLQFACLDRAAVSVRALTDALGTGGGGSELDPQAAARLLVPLSECDDLDALAKLDDGLQAGGSADTLRARMEAWDTVARARTRLLFALEGWPDDARAALALARAHGLPRVEAWAHLLLGIEATGRGELEEGAVAFDRAVTRALAVGDQTLAVNAISRRAHVALQLGHPHEAEIHLGYARASLPAVRAPENADYLAREISMHEGRIALALGDFGRAVARLRGAVADGEAEPWAGNTQAQGQLATLYGELGNALKGAGEPEAAVAATERALELLSALPGVHRGLLATTHQNLAVSYIELRRFADADEHLARARELYATLGAPAAPMGTLETNAGWLDRERGRLSQATAHQQLALALFEQALPPDHPELAYPLAELALVARARKHYAEAITHAQRAVDLRTKTLGPRHPETAYVLTILARLHVDRGDLTRAEATLGTARDIFAATEHPNPLDVHLAEEVATELAARRRSSSGPAATGR